MCRSTVYLKDIYKFKTYTFKSNLVVRGELKCITLNLFVANKIPAVW